MLIFVLFLLCFIGANQFSSVARSCLTICDPMEFCTPGLPVHQLLELLRLMSIELVMPSNLLILSMVLETVESDWRWMVCLPRDLGNCFILDCHYWFLGRALPISFKIPWPLPFFMKMWKDSMKSRRLGSKVELFEFESWLHHIIV